jgi:predicted nucleic acid-binding protein
VVASARKKKMKRVRVVKKKGFMREEADITEIRGDEESVVVVQV